MSKWEYDSDNLPVCPYCEKVALQRLYYSIEKHVSECKFVLSNYCPNCGADMRNQEGDTP